MLPSLNDRRRSCGSRSGAVRADDRPDGCRRPHSGSATARMHRDEGDRIAQLAATADARHRLRSGPLTAPASSRHGVPAILHRRRPGHLPPRRSLACVCRADATAASLPPHTARRSFVDRSFRRPSLTATAEKRAYFPFRVNSEFLFSFDASKFARLAFRSSGGLPAYLHASILIQERRRCKPPRVPAAHAILSESDRETDMVEVLCGRERPIRRPWRRGTCHLFLPR